MAVQTLSGRVVAEPCALTEQAEVFALLQNSRTHGCPEPVIRIDTHGAVVFLAGPNVYKVKRAVLYSYMDFSTLEKRRAACEAEVTVNRDNAPGLYVGVVPVTRDGGLLRLGGTGPVVEWAVHLRRFDENATFDRLAEIDQLSIGLIDKLAQVVVASHRLAPVKDGSSATSNLRRVLDQTLDELAESADLFPPSSIQNLSAALKTAFDLTEPLLLKRGAQAQVRRCHGDLHLGNIALIDGSPVLFDALEFDETMATTDILYDLAFAVMDLCERTLDVPANRLLNGYLSNSDDQKLQIEGLAAFPMFLGLRAVVRAKVKAALFRLEPAKPALRSEALRYFKAAGRFLTPVRPMLIAVGGLSGTGKTTLAAAIAPALGQAPGALHLRSDILRKRLFAASETQRLSADAYRAGVSADVYGALRSLAEQGLSAGQTVIVDATFQRPEERAAIAVEAEKAGVSFLGLWLQAPVEVLVQRVQNRQNDASDAGAATVLDQARKVVPAHEWCQVDSSQTLVMLKNSVLGLLQGYHVDIRHRV